MREKTVSANGFRVPVHTTDGVMTISADFSRGPPILGASAPAVQGFGAKWRRHRAGNEAVCLGTTRGTYGSLSPRRKMCGVDGASVIFVVDDHFRGGGATPDGQEGAQLGTRNFVKATGGVPLPPKVCFCG